MLVRRLESGLALVLASAICGVASPASAQVSVTIVNPSAIGTSFALVPVEATVVSTYALASVIAKVDDREVALSPSLGHWRGTLDLTGMTPATKTLTVTALDVFGSEGTATRVFAVDDIPTLLVVAPEQDDVAAPVVRLAATCTDDGPAPCTVEVRYGSELVSGVGAVDLKRSFAAFDGQAVVVSFIARDGTTGQGTEQIRTVHAIVPGAVVERQRLLPGSIVLDEDATRVLYARDGVAIHDLTSGAVQQIYDGALGSAHIGFLSPLGAIFVVRTQAMPFSKVFEWRNGVLIDLGGANGELSLRVAGDWAIWNATIGDTIAQELVRRNLQTGTTSLVSDSAGNADNDVATNGDVVFWDSSYQIQRLRGGVTTPLTSGGTQWNTYPRTDGTLVVFRKHDPGQTEGEAWLHDGTTASLLTTKASQSGQHYQVADGWVAFTKPDASDRLQAWTRTPSGEMSQVSFLGSGVTLAEPRAVDPAGYTLFNSFTSQYIARAEGVPTPGQRLGPRMASRWVAGRWRFAYRSLLLKLAFTPGCTYDVVPSSTNAMAVGGDTLTVAVNAAPSCEWATASEVDWIRPAAGTDGSGMGSMAWTVVANAGAPRSGAVWVAGQRVTVSQDGTDGALDTDGDLLPDAWEIAHGLNPASSSGDDGADGDPDGDQQSNLTELQQGTSPVGHDRFLAEGVLSSVFDTQLALLNPGVIATVATLSYLQSGKPPVTRDVPVPARTRVTVDPRDSLGPGTAEFSTRVVSSQPLVVDRTVTWKPGAGHGAHAETAVAVPAATWFLAEGATHSGFNLFYLLQNPGNATASVRVRYLRGAGAPLEKVYTLPPQSRTTIWVNLEQFDGLGAALVSAEVSAAIEVQDGPPIIVERAMYRARPGQTLGAGHVSAGVTAPATDWFLAEGATGEYFDLFLLVANPSDQDAQIEATYLLPDGMTVIRAHTAPANSRYGIWVDHEDARLADTAVSMAIRVVNGVPVVVERSMWWPGDSTTWHEAHNAPGATATGTRWALAEGEVGGLRGIDMYVLIANTSSAAGDVRVTLLFEDGTSLDRTFVIGGQSRFNVDPRAEFPDATDRRFAVLVESLGGTPVQLVVERAMYWDAAGQRWAAGTAALATRLP